jgi:FKBP12-rapamycin complex-associated protein
MGEAYNPLARDLFAPAFLSVYTELSPAYQEEVVRTIELVLRSPNAPSEICQALLNMAEYLERHDKNLPISISDLGRYALRCQAYAKALHYKELECLGEPSPEAIESLVEINQALEQPDVAVGILTYAQQAFNIQPKEEWYERLQRWDDALILYERRLDVPGVQDEDGALALGRMRCLNALAQWDTLAQAAQTTWEDASDVIRRQVAPLGASAAWGQGAPPVSLAGYAPSSTQAS